MTDFQLPHPSQLPNPADLVIGAVGTGKAPYPEPPADPMDAIDTDCCQ